MDLGICIKVFLVATFSAIGCGILWFVGTWKSGHFGDFAMMIGMGRFVTGFIIGGCAGLVVASLTLFALRSRAKAANLDRDEAM